MARIAFRPLWTISVQHGFYGGACDALSFTVPPATERALAGAHALLRVLDGALHVLVEVDDTSAPLSDRRFRSAMVRALDSRALYRVRASSTSCESR